ncbi:unnamed protein product [Orchesella dallaii]|uniref:BTB domain-containing protein n=1 Tax=Orchesella dallaii TaxID=48710 RepID=A0ABP1QJK0_9HEXA
MSIFFIKEHEYGFHVDGLASITQVAENERFFFSCLHILDPHQLNSINQSESQTNNKPPLLQAANNLIKGTSTMKIVTVHTIITLTDPFKLEIYVNGGVLEGLCKEFGDQIKMKCCFSVVEKRSGKLVLSREFERMKTRGSWVFDCSLDKEVAEALQQLYKSKDSEPRAIITIQVTQDESLPTTEALCKKLLTEGIGSDLTLLSNDGNEFNCHKHILAASSPYFGTMLRIGEWKQKSFKLDLSDKSVASLLKFLYCADLDEIWETHDSLIELFEETRKHNFSPHLEKLLRTALLEKVADSFDIDDLLRLFHLCVGVRDLKDLKQKMFDAIKVTPWEELAKSAVYKKIMGSETGLELIACFMAKN